MAEIRTTLVYDTDKQSFENVVSDGGKLGEKTGKKFSRGFKKTLSFGSLLKSQLLANAITGAFNKLSQAVQQSVDDFRQFSKATAEVNTLLGANEKLTDASKNAFISLSSQYGTEAATQAKGFYNIVSAGVQGTANQLSVLQKANIAATAGLVDIDTAAKVLVSSVNSYGSSVLSTTQASDALFAAVKLGQTTFTELSSSIGSVASLAATAGVSFTDLTGTIAFLTKSGISTEESVVGIKSILTAVIKPSEEAAKKAKELGIQFNSAAIKTKGFSGFLKEVVDRTKGNTDSLAKLFGNVRALSGIVQIAGGRFNEFKDTLDQVARSSGITAEAFQDIAKSADFKLKQKAAELRNFFLVVTKTFADTFIVAIGKTLPSIGQFTTEFIRILKAVNIVVNAFGILRDVIGLVFDTLGFLVSAFVGTLASIAAKISSIFSPSGSVTKSLQSFAKNAEFLFEGFKIGIGNNVDDLFSGTIFGKGTEFIDNLEQNLNAAQEVIDFTALTEKIDKAFETATSTGTTGAKKLELSFKNIFSTIKEGFKDSKKTLKTFGADLKSLGQIARDTLAQGVATGFNAVGAALANGTNALDAFGKAVLASFGTLATQLGQFFILKGAAIFFENPAIGGGMIAAGAALSAFGGFLSAKAGGGGGGGVAASTSGGGGSVSGGGVLNESVDLEPDAVERQEEKASITLNIQGDVLDSRESGLKIVELLQGAFDLDGAVVSGGNFT